MEWERRRHEHEHNLTLGLSRSRVSFAATCEPPTRSCLSHQPYRCSIPRRNSVVQYWFSDPILLQVRPSIHPLQLPRSVTVSHSRDLQAPFTYWNAAPFAPGSSHTYRTFWKFLRTTLRPLRTDALDPTSSRALCLAEWALILYYINFLQILMASTYSSC